MSAPSSAPRGEHSGRPGTRWETQLVGVERVVEDGRPEPRANRAARRAARKAAGGFRRTRGDAFGLGAPEKPSGAAIEARTGVAGTFSRPGVREAATGPVEGLARNEITKEPAK